MEQQVINAIESCRECAITCKACAASLKEDESMQHCISSCLECAMICELCVSLGESHSDLFLKSLDLAMDACMRCIDCCEKNQQDTCIKCAWQCRKTTVDMINLIG
jgi:hypothetical protein